MTGSWERGTVLKSQSESQVHQARLMLVHTGKHHPQQWSGLISDTTVPATSVPSRETGGSRGEEKEFFPQQQKIYLTKREKKKQTWFVWPSETRLEMTENDSVEIYRGVNIGEGGELFNLEDNAGTRANGYKLIMNKFRLEIGEGFQPLEE